MSIQLPPGITPAMLAQLAAQQSTAAAAPKPAVGGFAATIANAQAGGNKSGQYFEPGRYLVELRELKIISTVSSGEAFIAEFDVVESDNPGIATGDRRSWYASLTKPAAVIDVKEFLLLIVDAKLPGQATAHNFDPAIVHWAVGADQPCKGMRFALNVWAKQQKRDPSKTFNRHEWRVAKDGESLGLSTPAPTSTSATMPTTMPTSAADIQALLAKMGGG